MEVWILANIKSAKKRILVSQVRADRNKAIKSGVKTAIKKVNAAVESGDKAAAVAALAAATGEINSAASKGVYHKNAKKSMDFQNVKKVTFFNIISV